MRLFSFLRGRSRSASGPANPPVLIEIPSPPPRPRNPMARGSFTHIELPWLSLRLPGESWTRSGNPDAFEYVSRLTDEQLIVMVVPLAAPLSPEQQRAALESLIAARRDAVVKLSEGLAELDAPEHRQGHGHCEIRQIGLNHQKKIQFAFLARAAPTAVVNLSLYRYNVDPNPTPFKLTAQRIFDKLQLK
jgi:hypothetical protein